MSTTEPRRYFSKAGPTSYSYNLANELQSESGSGKPVSYTYTGDALMATSSTSSDTTSYTWDTEADIPNLATETDVQGKKASSITYTYAQGPLGLITSQGSYTFHSDALGSIVEVSDSSAESAQSYRYDPFGNAYATGNSSQAADRARGPPSRGCYLRCRLIPSRTSHHKRTASTADPTLLIVPRLLK